MIINTSTIKNCTCPMSHEMQRLFVSYLLFVCLKLRRNLGESLNGSRMPQACFAANVDHTIHEAGGM